MSAISIRYMTRRPWAPAPATLRRWVAGVPGSDRGELGLRVVGTAEGRSLNQRWRGKDCATNVLSFPMDSAAAAPMLGDIVICAPVLAREAREQGKELRAHWAHMVIHGVLHLLGYDHQRASQARIMEKVERELLGALGYPDPYGS